MIEVLAFAYDGTDKHDIYCGADFIGEHKLKGSLLDFVRKNSHRFPQFRDAWTCIPRNGARLVRIE